MRCAIVEPLPMETRVSTQPKVRFTPEEYLELERKAETTKSEYLDGEMFPMPGVSRQHARIVADAGGYFLEDPGSANGTFLNDRRLPAGVPTRMRNGDRVRIGKVQMTFILGN